MSHRHIRMLLILAFRSLTKIQHDVLRMLRTRRHVTSCEFDHARTFARNISRVATASPAAHGTTLRNGAIIHPAGSPDAQEQLKNARFDGVDDAIPHISDTIAPLVNVVVIPVDNQTRDVEFDSEQHSVAYLREHSSVCTTSTAVISNGRILSLFLTSDQVPALSSLMQNAPDVYQLMSETHRRVATGFYRRGSKWNGKFRVTDGVTPKRGLRGYNYLGGMQYFSGRGGAQIKYYPVKQSFNDSDWSSMCALLSGMQALEETHVPAIANTRRVLHQNSGLPAVLPGMQDMVYATTFGGSRNFSCQLHDDSGRRGTTESIFWTGDVHDRYAFFNAEADVLFLLRQPCCMYIPPNVKHGSVSGGEHDGLGFVLMTKVMLSCPGSTFTKERGALLQNDILPNIQK